MARKYVILGHRLSSVFDLLEVFDWLDDDEAEEVTLRALSHLGISNRRRDLDETYIGMLAADLVADERAKKWVYEAVRDMEDALDMGKEFLQDSVLDVEEED